MRITSRTVELSADLLEPFVDTFVDTLGDYQVLKDVPILGSAVKIAGIGKSISDRIFLLKVRRFLTAIDPTTTAKARTFAEELRSGEAGAGRTAQVLVFALNTMDDLEKAPILAAVFTAFLLGEINNVEFRRITAAVNAALVDDLLALASLGSESGGKSDQMEVVDSLRHTRLTVESGTFWTPETLGDAVTPLGKKFIDAMARFGSLSKK
jgi:hypothetical protein